MIPPFHWWRTVFFLIPAITVYTVVLGAISLASVMFDRRGHVAHWCARTWSWLILATTGVQVQASGLDHLSREGAYLFVSNHQSIYDTPIVWATLPFQLRIIAKASLGAFPVLGWHLRYTGHLLVDRVRPGKATLNRVAELMRRGHSLSVYAEGTRSLDGQVAPFKPGLFFLAVDAGLPVVPVAVVGSRHVMRKGRLMTCPGDVEVVVHEPISTRGLGRADVRSLAARTHSVVSETVRSRSPALDEANRVRSGRRAFVPSSAASGPPKEAG